MKLAPLLSTILLLSISAHAQTTRPDEGEVKKGVYYNLFFSFGYEYPKGWIVHEEAINDRIRERAREEAAKSGTSSEMKHTYLLFTVSRHPRGHPVALNPTILVAAEKITHVRGNPTGKDYLLNLRSLKQKRGGKPLLNEPVEFRVQEMQFFRDDYYAEVNGISMNQAIFVTVKKGYAVIFSFTGEDQQSVQEMAKTIQTVLPLGMGGNVSPKPKPN